MENGFLGFLDVLGFSALISGGEQGPRLTQYLECIQSTLARSSQKLDYVVFSDTILLTTQDESDASFQGLLSSCSSLFGNLLVREIALRGAIAHGPFVRKPSESGVFVAGRAVIDAYNFEEKQDWVGIMLAPSAVKRFPNLKERCAIGYPASKELLAELNQRVGWSAHIQEASIPFHPEIPLDTSYFEGFAVVPTLGNTELSALRDDIAAIMKSIAWLKSLAPTPAAQAKYQRAHLWLGSIQARWRDAAVAAEQVAARSA